MLPQPWSDPSLFTARVQPKRVQQHPRFNGQLPFPFQMHTSHLMSRWLHDGIYRGCNGTTQSFTCTMKNEQFANAFRQLNQSMEFVPNGSDGQAGHAGEHRNIWIVILVISLLLLVVQFLK
jgi:hypothetical protein